MNEEEKGPVDLLVCLHDWEPCAFLVASKKLESSRYVKKRSSSSLLQFFLMIFGWMNMKGSLILDNSLEIPM